MPRRPARTGSREIRWAFAIVGTCATIVAHATPSGRMVRFSYGRGEGAEGCPGEDVVRRVVRGHLGRDPFDAEADQVLQASVERTEDGLRARIRLTEDGRVLGQSDLTSATHDCEELGFSMMLALSIAIDPLVALRVPAPTAVVPQPEAVPSRPSPPAIERAAPARPEETRVSLGVGGHVAAGLAPAPAAGLTLRGRARRGSASLGFDVRWDPPAWEALSGGELATSAALGGAVACWHLGRLAGCGVLSAGTLRIAARGLGEPSDVRHKPLATLGPRISALIVSWRPFSLGLHAEWLVAPLRTTVEVDERPVWTLPRSSFAAGLTLDVRLR